MSPGPDNCCLPPGFLKSKSYLPSYNKKYAMIRGEGEEYKGYLIPIYLPTYHPWSRIPRKQHPYQSSLCRGSRPFRWLTYRALRLQYCSIYCEERKRGLGLRGVGWMAEKRRDLLECWERTLLHHRHWQRLVRTWPWWPIIWSYNNNDQDELALVCYCDKENGVDK